MVEGLNTVYIIAAVAIQLIHDNTWLFSIEGRYTWVTCMRGWVMAYVLMIYEFVWNECTIKDSSSQVRH